MADRIRCTVRGAHWPLLALAPVIALLYWPSALSLWQRWQPDPSYSHGWLVFLIAGWLVLREGRAGRLAAAQPCWLGLAAIPVLGVAWLLAMAGSIAIVQWLLLPAFLGAAALAWYGRVAVHRLSFPIGFTLFAIPLWDGLTPILQAITTKVVGAALIALRIPALLIGNLVELPVGRFEIVEGCSGMHFFMVSGTLATLYGWLFYGRLKTTLGLVAVALAVALLANWLRVFLVIYAGYVTDMQHFLVQVDHYYFGWFMYLVMMAPVLWLARLWEPLPGPAGASAAAAVATASAAARPVPYFIATVAALAVAPLVWGWVARIPASPGPEALPAGHGGWDLVGQARPDWRPRYRNPDVALDGAYWRDGRAVDVWVSYYTRPRQGREVASQSNRLAGGEGRLSQEGGEAILDAFGARRVIYYVHLIGGRESTGRLEAKWQQMIGTLSGRPEGALLAFSATCDEDCDGARALLADFERDMGGALRGAIDRRRSGVGQ